MNLSKLTQGLAFLTLAFMAATPALADQKLALQAGQKLKIECAEGLTLLLQDGVVQCGLVCEMNVIKPENYFCDQGGCVGTPPVIGVKVTVREKQSYKVLLSQEYDAVYAYNREFYDGLKKDLSGTCAQFETHETVLYQR
ncbi:MAG: hypothetical protein ACJ763_00305 [Bdellovibrionia bacterium]